MGTYIGLCSYTDQGIRSVKESPARTDVGRALLKKLGGEMKQVYLTMGAYDYVIVFELPSDEAAASFLLTIGGLGNVRTTTLKAFDAAATHDIIANLPEL